MADNKKRPSKGKKEDEKKKLKLLVSAMKPKDMMFMRLSRGSGFGYLSRLILSLVRLEKLWNGSER